MQTDKIGTHSGSFHCDEALACYMLRLLPKYKDAEVVRTRDKEVLASLPIIVDVGAVYEPENGRFDHHQRGFMQTFTPEYKTKLSTAGLIYKHFGEDVIRQIVPGVGDEDLAIIYKKVYDSFIEALDGIDNGILQYPEDIEPAYRINTDLSARVGRLNPNWNEKGDIDMAARFAAAMELAGSEFVQAVEFVAKAWIPARKLVQTSMEERMTVHESGEIVLLKEFTLWKKHIKALEEEMKVDAPIKYVLYQDTAGKWRVQCVPTEQAFVSRLPLPEEWRGIRDQALSDLTGIPGCIFVHAGGFIGGNATFEGVLEMASRSLLASKAEGESQPK
eukprot:CAMPEP_0205829788 /NCGR_PEP_ID=MMETSP0206-20130828/39232_1 /ASSEMBLY_ACC=CAM_ASM_000279 /TAXON_ID=36767 /ORGANISM="Euplotes focardii, Strain TN1" /LENGTH=331 /DNA_ID=CAMNT_0053132861 /DNA_START=40 /DNA_END=1032 /DNA_ORIENTATION=+